jgi:hypothetical protein
MKNVVAWNVTRCGSCKNRRFVGMYRLHHPVEENELADSFHRDEGGNTFLRNVGYYKSHVASHPRRLHSSVFYPVPSKVAFPNPD